MGQAKRRGTFEERKEQSASRREERWKREREQSRLSFIATTGLKDNVGADDPVKERRRKIGVIGHVSPLVTVALVTAAMSSMSSRNRF